MCPLHSVATPASIDSFATVGAACVGPPSDCLPMLEMLSISSNSASSPAGWRAPNAGRKLAQPLTRNLLGVSAARRARRRLAATICPEQMFHGGNAETAIATALGHGAERGADSRRGWMKCESRETEQGNSVCLRNLVQLAAESICTHFTRATEFASATHPSQSHAARREGLCLTAIPETNLQRKWPPGYAIIRGFLTLQTGPKTS